MDFTRKSMSLQDAGIVLSWLSSILTALISSWAGTWVKMLFEELLGKDAPLPNLTEWFLASAYAFWIVPVGVGIALFITRKYRHVQDRIVLATWGFSVMWLACAIAAFLLPLMCIMWRLGK